MCLYTKYIKNPKYKPNKKNGFNPPECKDLRTLYVPIECGKCIECRKKKKRNWIIRLNEELRRDNNCYFITLTFNDKCYDDLSRELFNKVKLNYEEENELCTKAIRRYLEVIRWHTGKMPKHWFITEKGEDFGRIHLHGIIWSDKKNASRWQYGYFYFGDYVNEKTINYITKYMLKIPEKHKEFIGKVLSSKGIGNGYIKRKDVQNNRYIPNMTNEMYRLRNGQKMPLPQYYRNYIYTEEEREKLWIEKQDRGYRYISGEKVQVDNEEEYNNILEYYQEKGKRLYGDNPEEWDKQKQRRKLQKMKIYREKELAKLRKASPSSQARKS